MKSYIIINIIILLFDISNQSYQDLKELKDYLIEKQNIIKYIIDKDLYNDQEIISNQDKLNLLSLYLMYEDLEPDYKEDELINFNRLIQKKPIKISDFLKFNGGNKRNKLRIDNTYSIIHKFSMNEDGVIIIPLQKVCLLNLNNSKLEGISKVQHYYNLDELLVNNEISQYIEKIKDFLKIIVDSNVYKQAIKELFPNNYNYLNNNKEIKAFISKRIKFYPFQGLSSSGFSDKLSCYSYIASIDFKGNFFDFDDIEGVYKIALTVVNSMHEINHINQIIIFFKGNKETLINSPERKIERDNPNKNEKEIVRKKEGGICLEYLLFDQIIDKLDLFQCLYILNENNYKQELAQFKKNFKNIRNLVINSNGETKYIKIKNGIFKEFYDKSKGKIKKIIKKIKKDLNYKIPLMYIGKFYSDSESYSYFSKTKCRLLGGWKKFN